MNSIVISSFSVSGAIDDEFGEITGNGMRRLTVYIAVPTAVFLVCLCVVTYCLVSRRASRGNRSGRRHQRNYYSSSQQSHMKSPSAASSSSIGVSRNGVSATPGVWNPSGDPRLRPSPAGTGQVSGTLGYSSTNGSNSLTGTGQMVVPNQVYQTAVTMVSGTFPLLMGSQPATPYYAMQDANGIGTVYPQNVYPVSSAGAADYVLNSNTMNVYPPGMVYPMANGHTPGQNSNSLLPNSVLNSSSPDSSAITGPTETVEGRLMYPPPGQGSSPVFSAFQGTGTTCTSGATVGTVAGPVPGCNLTYQVQAPATHMTTNPSEMELSHNSTPLLSYQAHTENMNAHNSMRAWDYYICGANTEEWSMKTPHWSHLGVKSVQLSSH